MYSEEDGGSGNRGNGASIVLLRRRAERRRIPFLIFSYEDLLLDEVLEIIEEGAEAIEPVVKDDVVVGCLVSLPQSDSGWVD